jgi:hypothetical protein
VGGAEARERPGAREEDPGQGALVPVQMGPSVLVCATSRDQRPVQTNRPFPAPYRRAREPPAALWKSIVFTPPVSSHLALSTIYSTHMIILSTHHIHPNLLLPQNTSLPSTSHHRRRPLSPSQWRNNFYLDLGSTTSSLKR